MEHDASRSLFNGSDRETKKAWVTTEPKLAEILEDPIIQALMSSDDVDSRQLVRSLCEASSRLLPHARAQHSRDFDMGGDATSSGDPTIGASLAGGVEKD